MALLVVIVFDGAGPSMAAGPGKSLFTLIPSRVENLSNGVTLIQSTGDVSGQRCHISGETTMTTVPAPAAGDGCFSWCHFACRWSWFYLGWPPGPGHHWVKESRDHPRRLRFGQPMYVDC